ncbi:MAG TPA: accessory factor UbiK family protein, partial [Azospirillaceae bacterium]|nr:accessory factor UbiK family protein [Azospirillaceae bacterium]
ERILGQMDVVSREEFEAARAMAVKAREEQEVLNERVAALEAQVATLLADRTLAHMEPAPRRPAPGHHGTATPPGGAKAV